MALALVIVLIIVAVAAAAAAITYGESKDGFSTSHVFWSRDPAMGSPPMNNPWAPRSRLFRSVSRVAAPLSLSAPFARLASQDTPYFWRGPTPSYYGNYPYYSTW